MRGSIYNIKFNQGFAFIRDENNDARFVHAKDFKSPTDFDRLKDGQEVEFTPFELKPGDPGYKGNGLRAKDVVCLTSAGR